jgi:hypothetical protein
MSYKLYGVHGCGMCSALEQRMKVMKIPYEKIEDMEQIRALNLDSIPALDAGGKIMYFPEAVKFLQNA